MSRTYGLDNTTPCCAEHFLAAREKAGCVPLTDEELLKLRLQCKSAGYSEGQPRAARTMSLFQLHDSRASGVGFGPGDRYDQTHRPSHQRLQPMCKHCYNLLALPKGCKVARDFRATVDDALRHRFHERCLAEPDDFALTMYTCLMQNHLQTPAGLHEWMRGRLHAAQRALEAGDMADATREIAMMQDRMDVVA